MTKRIFALSPKIISLYVSDKKSIKKISDLLHVNIKTIRVVLRHNNIEIHGCKKNLVGQVFGRLNVIRYIGNDNSGKYMWECQCSCKNKTIVRGGDLTSGKIKSCGCLLSESSRENIKISHKKYPKSYGFKGIGDLCGGYLSQIKHRSFKKNMEYSVSKEYLWDLYLKQNKKCALSGLNIYFGLWGGGKQHGKRDQTASLDRMDSSKGYVNGNVWWIHKDINLMKLDYSISEFLNYCKAIVDNNKEFYEKKSIEKH